MVKAKIRQIETERTEHTICTNPKQTKVNKAGEWPGEQRKPRMIPASRKQNWTATQNRKRDHDTEPAEEQSRESKTTKRHGKREKQESKVK